jgi:hypothetical protein
MHIYIILLTPIENAKGQQDNKYYITKSDLKSSEDILKVYTKPKEINLAWMKKYKPIKIIEILKSLHEKSEYYIMIHYMTLYGIENVRSSFFPDLYLPEHSRSTIDSDVYTFAFVDKYQSYNYVPLFISLVEKQLYKFFNSDKYTFSSNKDYTIEEEINRLQAIIKNIQDLQKLITATNGVYYGPYGNKTFIDFFSLSKDNELMNKVYYYDDKYISKGNKYEVDVEYNNLFDEIDTIAEKLKLSKYCKKRSLLLLNLIEFNLQKKQELRNLMLEEANTQDVKYTTIDLIEYIILGLTEEKLRLRMDTSKGNNPNEVNEYISPPPYESVLTLASICDN